MSSLTKEQLKNELITHGVELPSSSARKSEYVELYEKHVTPLQQSKGEFSSDEEDIPNSTPVSQVVESLVVGGVDVSQLDDDEVYSRLQGFGATVGPIVDTTRKVYQKKLYVLMGGTVDDTPTYNGDVDQDEYSESEGEEVVEQQQQQAEPVVEEPVVPASPPPSHSTDIRRRVLASPEQKTEVIFDPARHTPSPRRSLRSVTTTTTTESTTYRRFVNNGGSELLSETPKAVVVEESEAVVEGGSKLVACGRMLVKLIILALLVVAALFAFQYFQNNPTESPFKAVEQMARQALDAAVGEQAAADGLGDAPAEEPVVAAVEEPAAPPPAA